TPDSRDRRQRRSLRAMLGMIPATYSVRPQIEQDNLILSQGQEASCVANALALAVAVGCGEMDLPIIPPARRLLMANAQELDEWPETAPNREDGTSVRAAVKAANKRGMALESTVPYLAGERVIPWTDAMRVRAAQEAEVYRVDNYRSMMSGS